MTSLNPLTIGRQLRWALSSVRTPQEGGAERARAARARSKEEARRTQAFPREPAGPGSVAGPRPRAAPAPGPLEREIAELKHLS